MNKFIIYENPHKTILNVNEIAKITQYDRAIYYKTTGYQDPHQQGGNVNCIYSGDKEICEELISNIIDFLGNEKATMLNINKVIELIKKED